MPPARVEVLLNESTPVFGSSVTPLSGKPEVTAKVGAGNPDAVTVKEPFVPLVKVVEILLVKIGGCTTARVKFCVASEPTPLDAVTVKEYWPAVPAAGVPESRPLLDKVKPLGRLPAGTEKVGAGKPLAVKLNVVPKVPTWKVVLVALVNDGARFTNWVRTVLVLDAKVGEPAVSVYLAVMEWEPVESETPERVAIPDPLRVTTPSEVEPSLNSTSPTGVPLLLVTVAVSVMVFPKTTGLALEERLVVVANRLVTTWVSAWLVLAL